MRRPIKVKYQMVTKHSVKFWWRSSFTVHGALSFGGHVVVSKRSLVVPRSFQYILVAED